MTEAKNPGGIRVLVADDNKEAADALAQYLAYWGYDSRVAYDGLSALDMARTYLPHIALLDLGLPAMDGYQVAINLRRLAGGELMKLIAITGHRWKDAEARSREYGFDHHLEKPVDMDELRTLLAGLDTGVKPGVEA
jgi:DNA-binding response OmpR family regulator